MFLIPWTSHKVRYGVVHHERGRDHWVYGLTFERWEDAAAAARGMTGRGLVGGWFEARAKVG